MGERKKEGNYSVSPIDSVMFSQRRWT